MLKFTPFALALLLAAPFSAQAKPFQTVFPQYYERLDDETRTLITGMDLQTGIVPIGTVAEINVPEGYYFLGPRDAKLVLTNIWGNPENATTLGLLFPSTITPFDMGGWALEVSFDEIGYVSDEDAGSYDYDDMLGDMRKAQVENNRWRLDNGYEPLSIVGWAATPHYNKDGRQLYWAKELKFGESEVNTLNYNIRMLGRKGVLIMNFIADIDSLPQVEAAVPDILRIVSFKEGSRYTDFIPGADTVAAVGIGGLIAGKAAAKAGLLVVLFAFLKKGFVLLLLPLIWLKNQIFGRKKPDAPKD